MIDYTFDHIDNFLSLNNVMKPLVCEKSINYFFYRCLNVKVKKAFKICRNNSLQIPFFKKLRNNFFIFYLFTLFTFTVANLVRFEISVRC